MFYWFVVLHFLYVMFICLSSSIDLIRALDRLFHTYLVKEVDALGGAMAAATDEAGIQFRILNSSKRISTESIVFIEFN